MASSVTTYDTTWATPRTWSTGELVTATLLNTHLRDQLTAIKTPASFRCIIDEASNYTTSSTSFTDIDATNLSATITTGGGAVMVFFMGTVVNSGASRIYFNIDVDGSPVAADDGLIFGTATAFYGPFTLAYLVTGLSAGSHTFKMQWKAAANTNTLYAGAGTATADTHPTFWGVELA